MRHIDSADEIPKLLADLKAERFFGDVTLHFRDGTITKLAVEQTQIFDTPNHGRNHVTFTSQR